MLVERSIVVFIVDDQENIIGVFSERDALLKPVFNLPIVWIGLSPTT